MPQHPKGDRLPFTVRIARPFGERLREVAAEEGLPVSEWVAALIERELEHKARRGTSAAQAPLLPVEMEARAS